MLGRLVDTPHVCCRLQGILRSGSERVQATICCPCHLAGGSVAGSYWLIPFVARMGWGKGGFKYVSVGASVMTVAL